MVNHNIACYKITSNRLRLSHGKYDLFIKGNQDLDLSPDGEEPTLIFATPQSELYDNDFPYNSADAPIFSKVCLSIIEKAFNISYPKVDVIVAGAEKQDWAALKFLEYTDMLDREQSIFDEDEDAPNHVGYLHKTLFRKDITPPPIFMIEETEDIYLSTQARTLLELNNINGIKYYPIFTR